MFRQVVRICVDEECFLWKLFWFFSEIFLDSDTIEKRISVVLCDSKVTVLGKRKYVTFPQFRYCVLFIIFTNPSARAGYDTRSIFMRSLTGLNLEYSFSKTSCLTKAKDPSLSYYLPIAGGRIIGFIPLQRVLVLYEMQPVSSRIWTRVAVFISYDDWQRCIVEVCRQIFLFSKISFIFSRCRQLFCFQFF